MIHFRTALPVSMTVNSRTPRYTLMSDHIAMTRRFVWWRALFEFVRLRQPRTTTLAASAT